MKDRPADVERLSLSRWSRRKREARLASDAETKVSTPPVPPAAPSVPAPAATSTGAPVASELPSVDSLGFDADFTAFLRPEVDEKLKRAALKQLFRDPRFNLMDGLDVYIDDYTKADPIAPDVLQGLLQRGFSALASPAAATPPEAGEGTMPAQPPLPAVEASTHKPASASSERARATAPEEGKPGSTS
ncbi:MAG TPA: DUF3306 domain-containing protein [Casimicrobiaceae bacterium]